ncbi:alpha-L-rhamnosidase [Devosia pacifica]|nr:alpha-L-rhamnosidase [Devosia pacifica]
MVRPLSDKGVERPASFLTKTFTLQGSPADSQLRISALGAYICFINGKRVGNDILTPGWTAYDQRISYQTYDVSESLVSGENTIEIWLADGWYRSQLMWGKRPIHNTWGDQIAAIAELTSGDDLVVATDESWKSGELPIRKSGIYFGEIYDARLEGGAAEQGAEVISFDTSLLVPHECKPVHELDPLASVKSWQDEEGRAIHDFGQNAGGYVAFTVIGEAGARVIVEHAEILDKDGNFYNGNLRTAECRLEYTLKGGVPESYRPHFTFQGFRYARITIEGKADVTDVKSVPISSVYPLIGSFTSGNELVNRLVENTIWSQRANFIEVPTDCPQRDERLGWTGDAQVFSSTACYLHDSHGFLTKYVRDLMADQREDGAIPHVSPDPTRMRPDLYPGFFGSTGWGDAIEIIPHTLFLHYADEAILREALPAMVKWADFVWSISDGPIVSPPRAWGQRGFSFGDWLQPKGPSAKPLPTISDEASATIYLYICTDLVSQIAKRVGENEIAKRMAEMAAKVRSAFQDEFITPSGRVGGDDQTSYALAVVHDLVPEDKLDGVRKHFRNAIARCGGRIGTGFIGTPALLPALVKLGELGLAQQMFLQEEVPGWLYQVKRGATTIWERWDAIQEDGSIFNPQMNSYNHYAYGAVCQWLFEAVAGFSPTAENPGFEEIVFSPVILPELAPVSARHTSKRGDIAASWTLSASTVTYDVAVPAESRGVLRLRPEYSNATVDGEAVDASSDVLLSPGSHKVTFEIAPLREGLDVAAPSNNTP